MDINRDGMGSKFPLARLVEHQNTKGSQNQPSLLEPSTRLQILSEDMLQLDAPRSTATKQPAVSIPLPLQNGMKAAIAELYGVERVDEIYSEVIRHVAKARGGRSRHRE